MQAGLVAAGAIFGGLILHTIVNSREMSKEKRALLAKQLAIKTTVGTEWVTLRDRLQADLSVAARPYPGDQVDSQAATDALRSKPGLYLRARLADVTAGKDFEQLALDSKRDAFAGCFLRERNERGIRGEIDGGAFAEQPWNVGQAYEATEILDEAWSSSVEQATEPLRLRLLREQIDQAVRTEIPIAAEIVRRAKFFLLVLDEGSVEPLPPEDGGVAAEEALQLVAHPARVFLFDLQTDRPLFRLRRSADARVIPAGERSISDLEIREAMQRQANNCLLARAVEDQVESEPTAPPSDRLNLRHDR
jgi:hypothetical protein